MKYLINKETKSVITIDADKKSIDQISGFVKTMYDKGYDVNLYLTKQQLSDITNETDMTFFSLLNTGLFLKK